MRLSKEAVEKVGLKDEEIKWQKVNNYTFDKYKDIVDFIFALLKDGKAKIRELHPGFNVGMSTGVTTLSDRWNDAYRHWSFVSKNHERDLTKAKK